jgi:hypothetical protein
MEALKAIEVKKAIFTLSDFLEIEPQELVSSICFLHKERFAKINSASEIWNKFDDADIMERAEMVGLKLEKGLTNDNIKIDIES